MSPLGVREVRVAPVDDLFELGYQLQIEPSTMIGVATNAMLKALQHEKKTGKINSLKEEHGNLYDLLDMWMNVPEVRRIRETYVQSDFTGLGEGLQLGGCLQSIVHGHERHARRRVILPWSPLI